MTIDIKRGQTVLLCKHAILRDDRVILPGPFHWFQFKDENDVVVPEHFRRPNGTEAEAHWLAVCEKCFAKHRNPERAIAQDGVWGDDTGPTLRPPI